LDDDARLILGLVLIALSIPTGLSAYSDGRRSWGVLAIAVLGIGLVAQAWLTHPGGYQVAEVPDVFLGVIARLIP
jgi:hypothetical protein